MNLVWCQVGLLFSIVIILSTIFDMKKELKLFIIVFCFISCSSLLGSFLPVSLKGQWSVRLDPDGQGMAAGWYEQLLSESVPVMLPGSIQNQGLGNKPSSETEWTTKIGQKLMDDQRFADYIYGDEFRSPFWLTPKRHYVGKVWYQRTICVPADWDDKRVVLSLERPHWQTSVWLEGEKVGSCDSLGTAHEYDITSFAKPGRVQLLTIMVDNDVVVPVGLDAHSISDQTQSNWNGIIGEICLKETGKVFLDDLQIYPDNNCGMAKLDMAFGNISGDDAKVNVIVSARNGSEKSCTQVYSDIKVSKDGEKFSTVYPIANAGLWSEFSPELYKLTVTLSEVGTEKDVSVYNYSFGMREIGISDKQFTINGKKTFLRGTLECCIFPDTGYPPMDVQSWKDIITTCRDFGLNHIRFHSWCPPEAAFRAADEMGFYYQVDVSAWGTFGSGGPLDEWTYVETDRMLKAYGNHPSFILLTPSNEPHGNVEKRDAYLSKWIEHYREKDPRRYYTAGSGWPLIAANNYHVKSNPRMHNYVGQRPKERPETAKDYRDFINEQAVPVISHEIGQWCAYPDFSEIDQYKGFLSASNIEAFKDLLEKAGLGELGHEYLMASGKFQALFYKEDIETALRTPHMAGFQLLDLHDFPGQGTAPVGVLNAYWKPKGYISADEYSRFCNSNVILARMKKLVFTSGEAFVAGIEQANYGATNLTDVKLEWVISDDGKEIVSGKLFNGIVPTGGLTEFGSIYYDLAGVDEAAKLTLEVADKVNGGK